MPLKEMHGQLTAAKAHDVVSRPHNNDNGDDAEEVIEVGVRARPDLPEEDHPNLPQQRKLPGFRGDKIKLGRFFSKKPPIKV